MPAPSYSNTSPESRRVCEEFRKIELIDNVLSHKDVEWVRYHAMLVMKVAALLNILNVCYDIIFFLKPDWNLPTWIGILQTSMGLGASIIFGLSTTIAALYGSRTLATEDLRPRALNVNEPASSPHVVSHERPSLFSQLWKRWCQTNPVKKALRVNQIMEEVILPHTSLLYDDVRAFRDTIRSHMLHRMGLSGLLNMLTMLFVYYNVFICAILYVPGPRNTVRELGSSRLLYLVLNVVNPLVCLFISYLVVLSDNFNSLVVYATRVQESLGTPQEDLSVVKQLIKDLKALIEAPLLKQLFTED